jgi:hypothetical protein
VPTQLLRAKPPKIRILWRRLWLEKFGRLRSRAKLAIASFIIHYLRCQAGIRLFAPDSDYPLTGLLLRNAPICISRAWGVVSIPILIFGRK